jgi:hypothetical protein
LPEAFLFHAVHLIGWSFKKAAAIYTGSRY